MATMNVSVPDPMRDWVQARIDSGRYASASDYVRDLIRKDQRAAIERQLSVEDIRRSIQDGRERGQTLQADEVFNRIEATLKALTGEP